MKKEWELSEESFNLFLHWLAADREVAARRYEELRQRLIQIFHNRSCPYAEDLADETFNRVMRRLPAMIHSYTGAPTAYLYATAKNVYLDYLEKRWDPLPHQVVERARADDEAERIYACLELCLERMTPANRELAVQYYQKTKQARIEHRKQLAERLGLALNALRIRICRLRTGLQQCIEACLQERSPAALTLKINDEMD